MVLIVWMCGLLRIADIYLLVVFCCIDTKGLNVVYTTEHVHVSDCQDEKEGMVECCTRV